MKFEDGASLRTNYLTKMPTTTRYHEELVKFGACIVLEE
jgi:hypothetical protein